LGVAYIVSNAPAEKALMAREGDDGPMMMMLEVYE
jgi:hypothetical protein